MRSFLAALAAFTVMAASQAAVAQSVPDTPSTPAPAADASAEGNAAVKDAHPQNAGPLAAGANSFTEGQAIKHIEHSGFTNVTGLAKDENGVWHGKAMKGGQAVNVALDFKGNVVTN